MPKTSLITWSQHDPSYLPVVEQSLAPSEGAIIGNFARVENSGFEVYVPVPDKENNLPGGGFVELTKDQARHIHAELGKLIAAWDAEEQN